MYVAQKDMKLIKKKVTLRTPSGHGEHMWAEVVCENHYRIVNAPVFHEEARKYDVVEALPVEGEPYPVFTRIVKSAGNDAIAFYSEPGFLNPDLQPAIRRIEESGSELDFVTEHLAIVTTPSGADWRSMLLDLHAMKAEVALLPVDEGLIDIVMMDGCKCAGCGCKLDDNQTIDLVRGAPDSTEKSTINN